MGFWGNLKDTILGGTSKAPGDFYTPYNHQQQIMGAITPGMATNRTAPQAGMDSPFRSGQLGQIAQLQGIAGGTQQGAGELAVQRQAQNALAAQQAQARMARGGNSILAARGAANNAAGIGMAAAGQGQQAAMQDQMNAQGMLTGALGQGRGQDQQVQLANLDAQLKQMGMDDATRLGYLQQLTGMDANTLQVQMGGYNQANQRQGLLGGLLSSGGQIGAAYAMKR